MQTPAKHIKIPATASLAIRSPLKKQITTIHIGKIAPIIAPKPLLIYFTPQVLNPLLQTKFKILKTKIVCHCFPLGQGSFLSIKGNNGKQF